jgi:hypothetical protein
MIETATKRRPTPRENAAPDRPGSMRKRVLSGFAHAREPRFGNAACGGLDNVDAAELRWDKISAGPLCVACMRITRATTHPAASR